MVLGAHWLHHDWQQAPPLPQMSGDGGGGGGDVTMIGWYGVGWYGVAAPELTQLQLLHWGVATEHDAGQLMRSWVI